MFKIDLEIDGIYIYIWYDGERKLMKMSIDFYL